jgi:tetratricopeptide (TPR) repeat protein
MLLGSADPRQQYPNEETFIIQLFAQNRFAEAYVLLKKESPNDPAAQFNLALCYFRSRHYAEALACLDKAQSLLTVANQNNNLQADQFHTTLSKLQNQQNDHLQGITKKYITLFADEAKDAIIRLKTDCWLQLGNFSKVIEVAKPLAHKNYLNIANALSMAENQLSI